MLPQHPQKGQKSKGLGIFAPPLPLLKSRANGKFDTTSKSTPNIYFSSEKTKEEQEGKTPNSTEQHLGGDTDCIKKGDEGELKIETISLPPISEHSEVSESPLSSPSFQLLSKHPTVVTHAHFLRHPKEKEKSDVQKLLKTTSLPVIRLVQSESAARILTGSDDSGACSDDDKSETNPSVSICTRSDEENEQELCKPEVIKKITETLPMSLMIKANQNVNKVVYEKKKKMIARCRRIAERQVVSDPRYLALQQSLSLVKSPSDEN